MKSQIDYDGHPGICSERAARADSRIAPDFAGAVKDIALASSGAAGRSLDHV